MGTILRRERRFCHMHGHHWAAADHFSASREQPSRQSVVELKCVYLMQVTTVVWRQLQAVDVMRKVRKRNVEDPINTPRHPNPSQQRRSIEVSDVKVC